MTIIDGTSGNDTLVGGIEDDVLKGLEGDDILDGGIGGDTLSVSDLGSNGGTWIDNVDGTWTFTSDPDFNGTVNLNYPAWDTFAPFGGYKQSGNGREYADWAIRDFCEIKGIVGWEA